MTIKQLAFDTQQHLQTNTHATIKRSHIYELLAAALGFNSYAALCADHVVTQGGITSRRPAKCGELVGRRCLELDYLPETAVQIAKVLPVYLVGQDIGAIRITDLVAHLLDGTGGVTYAEDEDFDDAPEGGDDDEINSWFDTEPAFSSLLLEGLVSAAEKGNASAHYALALIHDPDESAYDETNVGSEYWYNEGRKGRVLTGVEKEWADAYAISVRHAERYEHHLRAAGGSWT